MNKKQQDWIESYSDHVSNHIKTIVRETYEKGKREGYEEGRRMGYVESSGVTTILIGENNIPDLCAACKYPLSSPVSHTLFKYCPNCGKLLIKARLSHYIKGGESNGE